MTLEHLALSRSGVDRAAERRGDTGWLDEAWARPRTRVFPVTDGQVLVGEDDDGAPVLVLVPPAAAPPGERYLLGVDGDGVAYFAVATAELPPPAAEQRVAGLREVGAALNARDAGLLVHAVALDNWHRTHPCCSRCGAGTTVSAAGHVRTCPVDGSDHYPRTDGAVIMAVVHRDRILLGTQARWPGRRFSVLAGFVEPGESLEQAVRREVLEETGVRVGDVTYMGSQPWPFPSSLMLAFLASAETEEIRVDGVEIAAAAWFSRQDVADQCATGELTLPPPVSIARRLIEHWYGGPIPAATRGATGPR